MSIKFRPDLMTFLKGFAMGAADIVPGVSGGTIAFVTGIYERLLNAINQFHPRLFGVLKKEGLGGVWKAVDGSFLVVLLAGILTAALSLARVIHYLLDNHPILIWSFFFGLIVASAYHIAKQQKEWGTAEIVCLILGVVIAVLVVQQVPVQSEPTLWFVFVSGAIAITAMILPGISGSFILVLLGMYDTVLQAIKNFDLSIIVMFGMGCVVGILSFSHLLAWLLRHFRSMTLAVLTGFMLGSLVKVWPWKQTLSYRIDRHGDQVPLQQDNISPWAFEQMTGESAFFLWAVVLAVVGFAVVLLVEKLGDSESASL